MAYEDFSLEEIEVVMEMSRKAFAPYRKKTLEERAGFLSIIARELEKSASQLIEIAAKESKLPVPRLRNELTRTIFQLNFYGEACKKGDWLEVSIDTAIPDRNPPKPDIRKMRVPLGPVVVFGAANFPFAYSTAGGDTASALAAGCPVIVKAHPAHPETSAMVATVIQNAIELADMPAAVFSHVFGASHAIGKALVEHPFTSAVGFTGSFTGGKQLYDWACQRKTPIPVFAEMSSVNPVFLLPGKIKESAREIAGMYAKSITLNAGQFCTNPGLIIGIEDEHLQDFELALSEEIKKTTPEEMLHPGIFKNYIEKRANNLSQEGVETLSVSSQEPGMYYGIPTIATVPAENFISNPLLHQEVFGPFSLIIQCKDLDEMKSVAAKIEGQLTATVIGTEEDIVNNDDLLGILQGLCGRLIFNAVPTGVEVCQSMQHGGPFPATTDARFTSVGPDAILRFTRPLAFQNCENDWLPEPLKNENPLGIWRKVNNELTRNRI